MGSVMSRRYKALPPLMASQAEAADPAAHAALSASAGTGKTQVLTARVLRLLLGGARPETILCLTFTKAAAAEMANRIGARLAAWVRLKDTVLGTDLINLGVSNDPRMRDRARTLFATVLDAPGGLKIQTIHSFAQSLLAAFPAEAGLSPGFQPIEGRAEQELVRRTLADLMSEAEDRGDEQLVDDVQKLSRRLGEASAIEYLRTCAGAHEAMAALGPASGIASGVRQLLQLPSGDVEAWIADACRDGAFDRNLFDRLIAANRAWASAKSGKKAASIVRNLTLWLESPPEERARQLDDIGDCLVTQKNEPCAVAAGQTAAEPDYGALVLQFRDWRGALLAVRARGQLAEDLAAGLRAGQVFASAYERSKRAAGVADYNDLIEWTRALLAKPGIGDWVRFKLDRQVDHVLVDEAQDTNDAQWEIIERLVEEFFTGSSEAEARHRTLFMVGDFKQAIYAFQGSDPARIIAARDHFKGLAEALLAAEQDDPRSREAQAREFRDLSIAASFRSSQAVLDVVDAVIDSVGFEALALSEATEPHQAHNALRPGQVELWPPFEIVADDEGEEEGEESWITLRDRLYAGHLAREVRTLLDEAPVMASTGRPLAAGDILILVRSRGEFASLIVARLFAEGVPVAGVDRLHLHEPLAVRDLLASMNFAVQPDDDLNLANLLVSPLIGLSQDHLLDLAYGRKASLWRTLRSRAGEPHLDVALTILGSLLEMADFTTPAQFLETILSGPVDGRRRLYSRLGVEARDAVEELINSALEFERQEVPSLSRFLDWFLRGTVDVQRDPGSAGNEVRVMTVHGAKGLEAPLVILADATADPARLGRPPIAVSLPGERTPFLRPTKDELSPPFDAIVEAQKARDMEEHLRLLYVALTRAADRLVISGVAPKPKKDGSDPRAPMSWHRLVGEAMTPFARPVERGDGRVTAVHGGEKAVSARGKEKSPIAPLALPDWIRTPAPAESRPPKPLAPSAIAADDVASAPPSEAMRAAAVRGTLIHQLLERLVPVAPDRRHDVALRWLDRSAGVAAVEAREDIADQVCRILSLPEFAALFGPGSLGEAPLAATLADGTVVAGTVDRLLVEEKRISVIDFKTGRVPEGVSAIPAAHLAQMRAYREALDVIFPGREIRSALLYTNGPTLFELTA